MRKPVEILHGMINKCRSLEHGRGDPFSVDVGYFLKGIRQAFPKLKSPAELCLDGEAIDAASSILNLQARRLEYMSASLYRDPFLIRQRLNELGKGEILGAFLRVWHPLVDLEQMSTRSLASAADYWKKILPIAERLTEFKPQELKTRIISRKDLAEMGLMTDKSFTETVEKLWEELKKAGETDYWDFVSAPTYSDTLRRAILVSFLVTLGYANIRIDRMKERVSLTPLAKRIVINKKHRESIPISLLKEKWRKARRGKKGSVRS